MNTFDETDTSSFLVRAGEQLPPHSVSFMLYNHKRAFKVIHPTEAASCWEEVQSAVKYSRFANILTLKYTF